MTKGKLGGRRSRLQTGMMSSLRDGPRKSFLEIMDGLRGTLYTLVILLMEDRRTTLPCLFMVLRHPI